MNWRLNCYILIFRPSNVRCIPLQDNNDNNSNNNNNNYNNNNMLQSTRRILRHFNKPARYLSSIKEPTQPSQPFQYVKFFSLGAVITCVTGFFAIYPQIKEAKKDMLELLPNAIKHPKITEVTSKNYVERRDLEVG